eukprot:356666-Chlamydomonas_euryale.AAC.4
MVGAVGLPGLWECTWHNSQSRSALALSGWRSSTRGTTARGLLKPWPQFLGGTAPPVARLRREVFREVGRVEHKVVVERVDHEALGARGRPAAIGRRQCNAPRAGRWALGLGGAWDARHACRVKHRREQLHVLVLCGWGVRADRGEALLPEKRWTRQACVGECGVNRA